MNWNDLKEIWERQPLPVWNEDRLRAVEAAFAEKQRATARRLFWRDIVEAMAGVFVAGVFASVGWQIGRGGWPIAVAVLLMLGLSGFFVRERIRAARNRPAMDAPLLVRLEAEIAEEQRQRRLLLGVGKWYLGPCFLAAAIFGGTVMAHAPSPAVAKLVVGGLMAIILAVVGWGVMALNRRAVRHWIEPRLAELESWRDALRPRP